MIEDFEPLIQTLQIARQPIQVLKQRHEGHAYKEGACLISASNDVQAINCWLKEYQSKQTTYHAYRKESERFLLWCVLVLQKPLASVRREDIEAYQQFLTNPVPSAQWCGPRGARRGSAAWRPFVGPLGKAAQQLALAALESLFKYLVTANYLPHHPMSLMLKKKASVSSVEERSFSLQARVLNAQEWAALLQAMTDYPECSPHAKDEKMRLKMIVYMLYFLGLRVSELVESTWGQLSCFEGDWWFWVRGKGDKLAKIPLHEKLCTLLESYLDHFYPGWNLARLHEAKITGINAEILDRSMVFSWQGQSISPRYVNLILKKLAQKAAQLMPDSPHASAKLAHFSAHWLRHMSATHQAQAGVQFAHIQQNMRHSSDSTTKIYVHHDDQSRHNAIQAMNFL